MGENGRRDGPGSEDSPSPWFQWWEEGGWMDYGDAVQNEDTHPRLGPAWQLPRRFAAPFWLVGHDRRIHYEIFR